MAIVYKITNILNNKCYIGITKKTFRVRYNCRDDWWNAPSINTILKHSVTKYGAEYFKVEIIHETKNIDELEELEKLYIKQYNSLAPNGFNLTGGGEYNKFVSKETREKLSKSLKGKSPWNKGKKLTKEHIEKTRITKKIKYIEGSLKPWNKGIKTGRPTEKAIKNSAIAHHKKVQRINKNGQIEKIYDSITSVKEDGFNPGCVSRVCKGQLPHHKTFKWKYVTIDENQDKK